MKKTKKVTKKAKAARVNSKESGENNLMCAAQAIRIKELFESGYFYLGHKDLEQACRILKLEALENHTTRPLT